MSIHLKIENFQLGWEDQHCHQLKNLKIYGLQEKIMKIVEMEKLFTGNVSDQVSNKSSIIEYILYV